MSFNCSPCRKDDSDDVRKKAALDLIRNLPQPSPDRDMDRWGSSGHWIGHQTLTDTISVKWDDYWNTGTCHPIPQIIVCDCIAQTFQRNSQTSPTHIIVYHDGDEQAVRFENDGNEWNIIDQDGDKLMCYLLTNAMVRGSGFILKDLTESGSTAKSFSVGFFALSFIAEL